MSRKGPITARRKKPIQARSKRTVDALVAATARLIGEQGIDAVTTNRVASEAEVSVGSLYQYFPGKEALVAEVARRAIIGLSTGVCERLETTAGHSLQSTLRGALTNLVDDAAKIGWPELYPAVSRYELEVDVSAVLGRVRASCQRLLEDHQFSGESLRRASFALVFGVGPFLLHAAGAGYDRQVLVDEGLKLALGYLGTPRPPHERSPGYASTAPRAPHWPDPPPSPAR